MTLRNCWEAKKCGREPGGLYAGKLGVCPAAIDTLSDRFNGGRNGGRICWAVAGTLCPTAIQGTFAKQQPTCITCSFYAEVKSGTPPDEFFLLRKGQHYTGPRHPPNSDEQKPEERG